MHLLMKEYTTCRDILVCVCVCDLWTVGHEVILEHVPSQPLSPYFFHQSVISTFPEIFVSNF